MQPRKEGIGEIAGAGGAGGIRVGSRIRRREDIAKIFGYWQKTMNSPRSKLDDKRKRIIKSALKMGLHVAGGTDSDQVAPYNPFVSIRWLLDGKVIDGTPMRGPEESPNRDEALRMYSLNSAWFTFDEEKRELERLTELASILKNKLATHR